jgi:hypothetical protein
VKRVLIAVIWVDAYILAACTVVAHWFQRLTGMTSFFIARCGAVLWVIGLFSGILNYFQPIANPRSNVFDVVIGIILSVEWVVRAERVRKADEQLRAGRTVLPAWVAETRGPEGVILRMLLNTFVAVLVLVSPVSWHLHSTTVDRVYAFINYAGLFGVWVYAYFLAVTPLPPGVSRVRAWVNRLSLRPAVAFA